MTNEITTAHLTTDVVLLAHRDNQLNVLLIRRRWDPYQGAWALPGGYLDAGETFAQAAKRELSEETAVGAPTNWQRVGIYDDPDRDPRGRVVSVAYVAVLPTMPTPTAGDDARDAQWVPVATALAGDLAFDHRNILRDALQLVTPQ